MKTFIFAAIAALVYTFAPSAASAQELCGTYEEIATISAVTRGETVVFTSITDSEFLMEVAVNQEHGFWSIIVSDLDLTRSCVLGYGSHYMHNVFLPQGEEM